MNIKTILFLLSCISFCTQAKINDGDFEQLKQEFNCAMGNNDSARASEIIAEMIALGAEDWQLYFQNKMMNCTSGPCLGHFHD
jgi:hypothetical protein